MVVRYFSAVGQPNAAAPFSVISVCLRKVAFKIKQTQTVNIKQATTKMCPIWSRKHNNHWIQHVISLDWLVSKLRRKQSYCHTIK